MPKDCDTYELMEWRGAYNLTSETVFEHDYREMVRQISEAICDETNVFVGNVPHVTIPPITQVIGEEDEIHNGQQYYNRLRTLFLRIKIIIAPKTIT